METDPLIVCSVCQLPITEIFGWIPGEPAPVALDR